MKVNSLTENSLHSWSASAKIFQYSSGQTVVSTLVGIILHTGGAYIYLSSRQQDYLTPDTHTLTGGGQAGGSSQILQGYAA